MAMTSESLTEEVKRQRSAAKANREHDPFAKRLSPEIVSQIFQHCLPSPEYVDDLPSDYWTSFDNDIVQGSFTPLLFGAVCQHWRRIAWSTPRLWWLLSVDLHNRFDDERVQLSREWLDRSGQLPLTIIVDTRDRNPDLGRPKGADTRTTRLFMRMLSHYVHRANTLCFFVPSNGLFYLQLARVFESQYRSLIIFNVPERPDSVVHGSPVPVQKLFLPVATPAPQKLYINDFSVDDVGIRWDSLTEITGNKISLDDWVTIFKKAPNLIRCHIEDPHFIFSRHQQRVVHSKLSSLQVGWIPDTFWELFSFPALKSLCTMRSWDIEDGYLGDIGIIQSFLSASGCSLKSLVIHFWENGERVINFLDPHVELEELIVSQYLCEDLMRYLGETTRGSSAFTMEESNVASIEEQPVKFLPKLRRLVFDGSKTFDWSSIPYMITGVHDLSDMVCKRTKRLQQPRRPLQDVQFSLDARIYSDEEYDEIEEESLFILDWFVSTGCSVAIKDIYAQPENADVLAEARKRYEIETRIGS